MSASLSFIVDGIIVSALLGPNAMAAVNASMPVSQVFSMLAALFGIGAAGCISVAFGRRLREKADRDFSAAAVLLLITGVLLVVLQTVFFKQICGILLKNEAISPLIEAYYRNLVWGAPMLMLTPAIAHLMRAEGQAKLASAVILACNILNLIFDVVFIKFFGMGIGGASLATVAANITGIIVMFARYVMTSKRTVHFRSDGILHEMGEVLRTGLPAAFGMGLLAVKINFINNLVSRLAGSGGVVAFSICISCLMFMSMFISGAAQTMMPILGIYYGERDRAGVKFTVRKALTVLMICAGISLVILEAAPQLLLMVYGIKDAGVAAIVEPAIRIFSVSLPGTALSFLLLYYYMTVEKRSLSTVISLVNGLIAIIPCALLLSSFMGITGVWVAFSAAEVITIGVVLILEKGKLFDLPEWQDRELLGLSCDGDTIREAVRGLHDGLMRIMAQEGASGQEGSEAQGRSSGQEGSEAQDRSSGPYSGSKTALLITIAAEEIMENSREYNNGKPLQYDLLLRRTNEGLMLSITDNGKAFDPLIYTKQEETSDLFAVDHIRMLRSISKKVDYHRVIGLNKTYAYIGDSKEANT